MSLLITILTAPRAVNYFSQTYPLIKEQCEAAVYDDQSKEGTCYCFLGLLKMFLRSGEERWLYLEDDVLICRNLIEYARRVEIPSHWAALTLLDMRIADARPQRIEMATGKFCHPAAMILTRETAERLLGLNIRQPDKEFAADAFTRMLTRGFEQISPVYGVQQPSLVEHIGKYSAIQKRERIIAGAATFPGVDFDALTVL